MKSLRPCPFCGGEAELGHTDRKSEYGETSFVFCKKCSANGKMIRKAFKYSSDERAIEAWNRRADEPQRWTPVSEDKPELFQEVLVTLHENGWNGETYDTVKSQAYDGDYKITAWMPLPQPYKEKKCEE